MTAPVPYTRETSFAAFQAYNPAQLPNGGDMDAEFNRIKITTDSIIGSLALIQRSDGELANGTVGPDQLEATSAFPADTASAVSAAAAAAAAAASAASIAASTAAIPTTGGAQFSVWRKKSATNYDAVWAQPADARANILEFYSGTPLPCNGIASGSGSDMQPAATAAIAALKARYGRGTLFLPPQFNWRFASPVVADGIYIEGAGSQATACYYDNTTGSLFTFTGAGGYTGGGLRDMAILLLTGGTTGTAGAIILQGDASLQPGQMMFRDLYITSLAGNYWYNGVFCNGMSKTTGAQGIRVMTWQQVQIFSCRNIGAYFAGCVQPCVYGMTTSAPLAATGGADVYFTGGSNNGPTNFDFTYYADVKGLQCNGQLTLSSVSQFNIQGNTASLSVNSTANHGFVALGVSGASSGSFGANVVNQNYA